MRHLPHSLIGGLGLRVEKIFGEIWGMGWDFWRILEEFWQVLGEFWVLLGSKLKG